MKPFYGHFPRPILLEQCKKKLLEVTNFVFIRVSVSFGYTNICLQMLIMQCNFHPFKTGMLGNVGVRIIANFPPIRYVTVQAILFFISFIVFYSMPDGISFV
jgi:hypothetical protein